MTDSEGAKELLNGYFQGDREAMKKSIAYGRRDRIKWSDIALNAKLYPEFEATIHDVIKTVLGFNPPDHYILPQETFLRVAINEFIHDKLTMEQLFAEAELYLKLVRNELVRDHFEIYYDRKVYKRYS
ncbi:hypothetical protein ACFQ3S_17405 [Mucilaginibacter terrae]|uniref:hypothetical protein n=1 Tax=Mucilaginibacter terrae TaxID=1955052 RepID=UPI003638BAA5